jgi:hypothetical protein
MATVTLVREPNDGFYQRSLIGPVTGNVYAGNALGQFTVDVLDQPYFIAQGFIPAFGQFTGQATSGVAILDFGAFPGQPMVSLVVASPDVSDPNAELDAWVIPVATTDHTADEHIADGPAVIAAYTTPGTSFTITCSQNAKTLPVPPGTPFGGANSQQPIGQQQLNPYGKWSIAWAFSP